MVWWSNLSFSASPQESSSGGRGTLASAHVWAVRVQGDIQVGPSRSSSLSLGAGGDPSDRSTPALPAVFDSDQYLGLTHHGSTPHPSQHINYTKDLCDVSTKSCYDTPRGSGIS